MTFEKNRNIPWGGYISAMSCLPMAYIVNTLAADHPQWIELVYTRRVYHPFAQKLPNLTGAFPFSLTEILMVLVAVGLLLLIGRGLKDVLTRQRSLTNLLLSSISWSLAWSSLLIFAFLLVWGLNIHRIPVQDHLQLFSAPAQPEEVQQAAQWHLQEAEALRAQIAPESTEAITYPGTLNEMLALAPLGYDKLGERDPLFAGHYGRAKNMIFSTISAYLGIAGFFSPLTGEAHINHHSPKASLPFTACHELAHQRGYVMEDEASFVGFLACEVHPNPLYQYSAHFSAILYLTRALDDDASQTFWDQPSPGFMADIQAVIDYHRRYRGRISALFSKVHDASLKVQGQTQGVKTYDNVTQFLVDRWRQNHAARRQLDFESGKEGADGESLVGGGEALEGVSIEKKAGGEGLKETHIGLEAGGQDLKAPGKALDAGGEGLKDGANDAR